MMTVLPPTHNGSHPPAVLKRICEVYCFRNRWDPSPPMPQNLNYLCCSTAESVLAAALWCISIGVRGNVSLISTQATRHDNTCCSTCPLGILQRKVMIYFTEVFQETFLLHMFCLEIQTEDGRAVSQHKHLCKHVTKTGHVLLVCFTNSLHFLLQALPGASIKTARSWTRTTPLCEKICT